MIMRLGNARWKSLAPKNPPANARVARNERSCLKRGAFVSSSMPREMPLSKIGASPSSLRGALAPGLTDDFFDLSEPRLGRARLAPFLSEQHIVAEFELVEEDVDVEAVRTFVVHEPAFPEETVDDVVGPEAQTVEQLADRPALTRVPHQVEVREKRGSLLDAADAMEDRDALGHMQRVRVDAEGPQDSERGSSRMGRVDDRPRLAEELLFSEGHEGRFVRHDRTRVRPAASGHERTSGCGRLAAANADRANR